MTYITTIKIENKSMFLLHAAALTSCTRKQRQKGKYNTINSRRRGELSCCHTWRSLPCKGGSWSNEWLHL